jgi:hypothetical protein
MQREGFFNIMSQQDVKNETEENSKKITENSPSLMDQQYLIADDKIGKKEGQNNYQTLRTLVLSKHYVQGNIAILKGSSGRT